MQITFDDWTWDGDGRQLLHLGRRVHLSPKAFDLLGLLLQHRARMVSRKEAGAALWPGTFVSAASLAVVVNELRRTLGDSRREPRYLRTVHGHGYAFCGEGVEVTQPRGGGAEMSMELVWEGRVVPLGPGENILGRLPECVVGIASAKVSRRHARIVVSAAGAVIEDLGSKNGTSVGGRRIQGATGLKDGDEIGVGPFTMTFRAGPVRGSTETAHPGTKPGRD
jgi:DNA-binding winged helix-turn-helix (wHTH) protein